MVTFAFGLVHGFGFSFALRETLQFAGSHLLTSLLAFNVGVELGPAAGAARAAAGAGVAVRAASSNERIGTILLSAFVAHTAWHWLAERWAVFARYPFQWPIVDAAFLAALLRWAMLRGAGGAGGVDRAAAGRAAPDWSEDRLTAD